MYDVRYGNTLGGKRVHERGCITHQLKMADGDAAMSGSGLDWNGPVSLVAAIWDRHGNR